MNFKKLQENILKDIAVKVREEIDNNFRSKRFFDESWPKNKLTTKTGSLMERTGNLKNSFRVEPSADKVTVSSSMRYASAMNEGAEITVTQKMKKYFWAKHIEAKKKGDHAGADEWKMMALKKNGSKIIVPKRQFIGKHPQLTASIERIVNHNMQELSEMIKANLKRR